MLLWGVVHPFGVKLTNITTMNRQTSPKPSNCSPTIESIQFAHSEFRTIRSPWTHFYLFMSSGQVYMKPSAFLLSAGSALHPAVRTSATFSLFLFLTKILHCWVGRERVRCRKKERKNKFYIDSRVPSGNWCKYSSCHMNILQNSIDSLIQSIRFCIDLFLMLDVT